MKKKTLARIGFLKKKSFCKRNCIIYYNKIELYLFNSFQLFVKNIDFNVFFFFVLQVSASICNVKMIIDKNRRSHAHI